MCAEERAMCCETWEMKWSVPKPKKMSSSLFIVTFLCSRFHDGLKLPRWLLWATDLVKKMDFSPFCCYWMSPYITLSIAVSHLLVVFDIISDVQIEFNPKLWSLWVWARCTAAIEMVISGVDIESKERSAVVWLWGIGEVIAERKKRWSRARWTRYPRVLTAVIQKTIGKLKRVKARERKILSIWNLAGNLGPARSNNNSVRKICILT